MTGLPIAGSGRAPSRLAGIEATRFVLCYAVIPLQMAAPPTLRW